MILILNLNFSNLKNCKFLWKSKSDYNLRVNWFFFLVGPKEKGWNIFVAYNWQLAIGLVVELLKCLLPSTQQLLHHGSRLHNLYCCITWTFIFFSHSLLTCPSHGTVPLSFYSNVGIITLALCVGPIYETP